MPLSIPTFERSPPKPKPKVVDESPRPAPKKKELPFKVKKYLTRDMRGCKTATGYTAEEIYEMMEL